MSRFFEIKSVNPILTQKQTAKELCFSDSTLKRYTIEPKGTQRPQKSSKKPSFLIKSAKHFTFNKS